MSNNKNLTPAAKDKKARIIILVVTLCLSVAFILASILIAVLSDDYYDDYYYNNNSNNNPSVSGSLYMGSNSIYVGSDGVYYRFSPSYSGQYIFYSSSSNSSLDPKAVLYDSNWSQIDSDDDDSEGHNFSLTHNLSSGSTYYLKVTLYSGSTDITVTVNRAYSTDGSLYTGSTSVNIGSSSSEVYYSYTPSNDGEYTFFSAGSLDPKVVLYDSYWTQLDDDDDSAGSNNFKLTAELTRNKTYYLKFTARSGGNITVYTISGTVNGSLSIGSNTVSVDSSSDGVYCSFTPSNGGTYTFYSTGSADTEAVLYNSSLSQITSNDDGGDNYNFSLSYRLSSNTTYFLKVMSNYSGNLTVCVIPNNGSLSLGSNSVSLGSSGDGVYYSFTPSNSGTYVFYSSNSNIDPRAVLYDSSLSQLTSDDDGAGNNEFRLSYDLTSGNTYYLQITSRNMSGSTTITVNRGYSTDGSLSTGSNSVYMSTSEVYYSFTPSSSGTYTFTSSQSSSSLDPKVVLYDSNWTQLDDDDDGAGSNNFSLSYSLTANKTYYLKFTLYSNSGTVTVNVQRG